MQCKARVFVFQKPHIRMELRKHEHQRSKRSVKEPGVCPINSRERRCCRYPLVIDFDEFDWDFVIMPRRYHAYYCAGECTFGQSDTPHANLVELSHVEDGSPCCTPVQTEPLNMIYFDDSKRIIYSKLKDMVCSKCGCR